MPVLTSESVVLRTWPVREADLIVSFFTRDYGRVKGIAKSALKSRKRFGGALEPMTQARAWFAERPRQELVRLDQLEILRSPLSGPVDHARMAVLSFYAELIDEALPEHDPQETVFRLLTSVLEQTSVAQTWMPLTYFSLWMTRLMGLLPDIAHCMVCGEALRAAENGSSALKGHDLSRAEIGSIHSRALAPEEGLLPARQPSDIFYSPFADGLFCGVHRSAGSMALSDDSWQLAQRMLRAPVGNFATDQWPRRRGQDLRRFTLQMLERHLERKLRSAEALARLGG